MVFGRKKRRIVRLLVVEDEPLVAFDTEHFLGDAGFEIVATVDSVAEALGHLGSSPIDLVLVDLTLADGSGMEVARAAHGRAVPVLFVTGGSPAGADAIAAGCLAKPYVQRDLLLAIDAIDAVLQGGEPRKLPSGLQLFRAQAA